MLFRSLFIITIVKNNKTPLLGGGSSIDTFDSTSVSLVSATGSVKTFVAESPFRKYASIQNNVGAPLFCLLDNNTTAASSSATSTTNAQFGFRIAPTSTTNVGSLYEIRGYVGNINCTASTSSVSSTITTSP